MTYRGVYRDGVIVPESDLRLADGTRVDFDIIAARSARKAGKSPNTTRKTRSSEKRVDALMAAFGVRKNDKGGSSAAIARDLRRRALGKRFGG